MTFGMLRYNRDAPVCDFVMKNYYDMSYKPRIPKVVNIDFYK